MTQDSLLSWSNPLIFALITLLIILAVVFIYYRYAIIPLRKKHLEEKENLKLQHAELMALFAELSPDPILRFDDNGNLLLSNRAAHEVFGRRLLSSSNIKSLFPELANYEIENFIKEGDSDTFISDIDTKTFQWIIAGISHSKIGQIYGRDISELVAKEIELLDALSRAQKANDLKDDFLSRISHEIRSPLTSIQGISRLISSDMRDSLDEEYFNMLLLIENSSKRLAWTIDLIVNMAQIHTGNLTINKIKFSLTDLLTKLKHEFQSLADEKSISFEFEHSDNNFSITADDYTVEKILINLLDNAFKFTKEGKVTLTLSEHKGQKLVVISDTGQGISKKYMENLFTPFTQQEMGYSRSIDGLGLGLTLVKKFSEMNDIELKVKSEPGVGTEFRLIFK